MSKRGQTHDFKLCQPAQLRKAESGTLHLVSQQTRV
jgi:hypothetical protein